MARKLYYFDTKGYGEGIRYLLHYGGLEFEDVRISHEDYQKVKEEIQPPFGKVPVYKEGDLTLHQSHVIERYIARKLNLIPNDPVEEAQLDAVLHTLEDAKGEFRAFHMEKDPEKKAAIAKKFIDETLDFYYGKFDKQLEENKGHFGKELSWVDIVFAAKVATLNDILPVDIEKYPNIRDLCKKVENFPGIDAYLRK